MLMKDLFSVLEVAKLLDMSHSGVLYHIKNGSLKSTQVGKIYIITKEDFADFLKDKKEKKKKKKPDEPLLF
jgi:excisionase family DNA binding protein